MFRIRIRWSQWLATVAAAPLIAIIAVGWSNSTIARADEVLDWNAVTMRAIATAAPPGALQQRLSAIVHVSMFDALNGIDRRFTPFHVDAEAPRGASARAAVVYAAYTALVGLFPAQSAALAEDLEASLATIAADAAGENSAAIGLRRAW